MKFNKPCGIYCIENIINGKRYVGQSQDIYNRFTTHKYHLNLFSHENPVLQNEWGKYGEDSFIFYAFELCDKNELDFWEMYWIKELKTFGYSGEFGYNFTSGGGVIRLRPDKHRDAFSKRMSGKNNPNFGKPRSEETRKKLSNISDELRKFRSESILGEKHHQFGKPLKEETKRKMSVARKGNTNALGTKQKQSSSKYFGVTIRKRTGTWRCVILYEGKLREISGFSKEIDAAKAYDSYVVEHNISKPLNFPEDYPKRSY